MTLESAVGAALLVPALIVLAAFVGAVLQSITGIGFALVVAPFLVLLLGPVEGVLLVNMLGAFTTALILSSHLRDVEWRRYLLLAPPAIAGILCGTVIVALVPTAVLDLGIGALVVVAVLALVLGRGWVLAPRRRYGLLAGFVSGLMNTTAGVGGPAVSVYALASRWDATTFRSTMQAYFLTIALGALLAKSLSGAAAIPALHPVAWISILAVCVLGMFLGSALIPRVRDDAVRWAVLGLALVGGCATVVRGAVTLVLS